MSVSLLLSDKNSPYRAFADSFRQRLVASNTDVSVVETFDLGTGQPDLIVAVGMKAAALATAQFDMPVLVAMIPAESYQELMRQRSSAAKNAISAIFLDQPLARRLDFIRAVLPSHRRIGLLYSQGTNLDVEELRKEVERRGATLIDRQYAMDDRLFPILEAVLEDSDLLLGIPDRSIYSGSNIRNIMLASYRHNIPLFGISKAYVNAGALCAIFSTPEQLAEQAADEVTSFLKRGKLGVTRYPEDFSIELNQQVARSLGVSLPTHEVIRARMKRNQEQIR